ncbi:MAG TPA: hypothetical protein VGJ87_17245 [Roseiflexaceae bacterium]|jgi:Asp-tRNA(Asn)/Glu-tRNA(Gln) amidotransferase A subunit family amidase
MGDFRNGKDHPGNGKTAFCCRDLPIGVQIVPHHWREDIALGVAQSIETALGGWQRPPL